MTDVFTPAKRTIHLLSISAICSFGYIVAFTIKRILIPAPIVLTEGVRLLIFFIPLVVSVLIFLVKRKYIAMDTSVATFSIFLLAAFCFNLTVPAIFDRSVTVYLLNTLENNRSGMSETDIRNEFVTVYFGENHGIRKRLHEQMQGGNVLYRDGQYYITKKGTRIISIARILSKIYTLDPKIVEKK